MKLNGPSPSTAQTDGSGQFAFPGIGNSQWEVQPQKLGDLNLGISALDASYVLQSVVETRTFNANQRLACDVTGNGTVSALDATRILQLVVGTIQHFPVAQTCGSDWVFVPSAVVVPNQIVTQPITTGICQMGKIAYQPLTAQADGQDFLGILFGDCTGNWRPASGRAAEMVETSTAQSSALRVGAPRQRPSGTVVVPIYADNAGAVQALDLTLTYDSADLQLIRVRKVPQAARVVTAVNSSEPGQVRVAMAGAQPLTASDRPLLLAEFVGTPRRGAVRVVRGEAYGGQE